MWFSNSCPIEKSTNIFNENSCWGFNSNLLKSSNVLCMLTKIELKFTPDPLNIYGVVWFLILVRILLKISKHDSPWMRFPVVFNAQLYHSTLHIYQISNCIFNAASFPLLCCCNEHCKFIDSAYMCTECPTRPQHFGTTFRSTSNPTKICSTFDWKWNKGYAI